MMKKSNKSLVFLNIFFLNCNECERKSRVCSPVVGLPSELGVLLSRTLPRRSSSPSLVGTCWEHHSLTGLTPPTLPARKLRKDHIPSCVLAGAGCWGSSGCVKMALPTPKSTSSSSFLWSDVIALKTATVITKVTV